LSTLAGLLKPISTEVFMTEILGRRPFHHAPAGRSDWLDFVDVDELDAYLGRRNLEYSEVNVLNASQPASASAWLRREEAGSRPRVDNDALLRLLGDGQHSLVLNGLRDRLTRVGRLCEGLEVDLRCRVGANAYLSPAHGAAFAPHRDAHDVLILQLAGSKRWRIGVDPSGEPKPVDSPHALDVTLRVGQLLYLPQGTEHRVEAGDEGSVHLTVYFTAPTFASLIAALGRRARESPEFQERLPIGATGPARAETLSRFRTALKSLADRSSEWDLIADVEDEEVRTMLTRNTGRLKDALEAPRLGEGSRLRLKAQLAYRLFCEDKLVIVRHSGGEKRFPLLLRPVLERMLSGEPFTALDLVLPRAMADRIELIRQLLAAGILEIDRGNVVSL
jgi:lysine-specific demethylase/histidyl-hydroxylase NO66